MTPPGLNTVDLGSIFRLDDHVYVLAGAGGGGIGEATAHTLHALGAKILCVDRDGAQAEKVARMVDGIPLAVDVTQEDEVIQAIETAIDGFGRLDGVVDIVGGGRFTRVPELGLDEWDAQFTYNLRHAYLIGRHAGMRLAESGSGSIVFVTSVAAFFGSGAMPAYSAAKLALVSWVRSLAEEFGPSGVRVNSVAPGATLTSRMNSMWSEQARESMAEPTMLGRLGRPEEIAGPIAFLLSPAAGNITGQTILADGGASTRDPVYGNGRNQGEADIRSSQRAATPGDTRW